MSIFLTRKDIEQALAQPLTDEKLKEIESKSVNNGILYGVTAGTIVTGILYSSYKLGRMIFS